MLKFGNFKAYLKKKENHHVYHQVILPFATAAHHKPADFQLQAPFSVPNEMQGEPLQLTYDQGTVDRGGVGGMWRSTGRLPRHNRASLTFPLPKLSQLYSRPSLSRLLPETQLASTLLG